MLLPQPVPVVAEDSVDVDVVVVAEEAADVADREAADVERRRLSGFQ